MAQLHRTAEEHDEFDLYTQRSFYPVWHVSIKSVVLLRRSLSVLVDSDRRHVVCHQAGVVAATVEDGVFIIWSVAAAQIITPLPE
jgi:hypothetical protein